MPIEKIVVEKDRAWALWQITEDEKSLSLEVDGIEKVSDTLKNSQKRLEWLAGRVATKEVMKSLHQPFY